MNRSPFGQSILPLLCTLLVALCLAPSARCEPPAAEASPDKTNKVVGSDSKATKAKGKSGDEKKRDLGWKPLNAHWKECQFGGDGPATIKKDLITVNIGDPLTGVTWDGELVREDYEIELEARRTDGLDFFCALTFPVGEDHVSFVLGGWGGGVVGISNVDDRDASDNETTGFRNFDNGQWYKVRVRVDANEIRCWIDDKIWAEQEREGHTFDVRYEMDPCVPLGIASFMCDAEYRKLRWRKLTPKEVAAAAKKKADGDGE